MTGATKGERTRARILDAAGDLFIEHGIGAVSIRDIAAAAGVTHALVHRYFGTREQLLAAVVEHLIATTGAAISARQASISDPFLALRDTVEFGAGGGRTLMDLLGQVARAGIGPDGIVPPNPVRPFEELARTLASLQAADGAPASTADPAITALVVAAATFGVATNAAWLMASVGLDPADLEARRPEITAEIVRIASSTVPGSLERAAS